MFTHESESVIGFSLPLRNSRVTRVHCKSVWYLRNGERVVAIPQTTTNTKWWPIEYIAISDDL